MKAPTRARHIPFLCPRCGKPLVTVKETREWQGAIRRRRACAEGHVTVTKETITAA
jgi:transcriptional regulator NrdR family protein